MQWPEVLCTPTPREELAVKLPGLTVLRVEVSTPKVLVIGIYLYRHLSVNDERVVASLCRFHLDTARKRMYEFEYLMVLVNVTNW